MNKITLNSETKIRFIYDEEVYSGVVKVSEMVKKDICLVTDSRVLDSVGASEEASEGADVDIIFGTIGRSKLLDSLQASGEISSQVIEGIASIEGKREVYGFFPLVTEKAKRIVIAGSDKRGTIYGLFHISDLLGVSPLVNWSLAVPAKMELEITEADRFISKEPSVTYRGFFINDEWPCFGTWCSKHFDGFTVKAYEGVFEILLRMKGNYLWPAMWSSCFAEDGPGLASAELADELGIVMGLSHHEPCLRHGEEYSHVRGKDSIYGDAWNFRANREGITRFWRDGLKRNGHLENVITVGMRGERDSKIMGKDATLKDNIDLLRDVIKTQNQLIKEEVNSDLEKVPRMLALYKEVEPFYYGDENTEGLKNSEELEDVILMLCDDNHGYLRTLPDEEMRQHKGGFGMYYHFDYHGEPISYEWINSTYLPEVWEQMTTAYEHGVRSLWIVNVGDLGLNETPLSYFLSLAYDYDKYGITAPNKTKEYLRSWMGLQFGGAFGNEDLDRLTDVYNRANRLIHNRRPEHMNENVYSLEKYEAEKVLAEAEFIKTVVLELKDKCHEESRPAFIELIAYNLLAGMNLIEMWIYRAYNHYFASIGVVAANDYAEKIKECIERDKNLADELGSAADGKWDGFQLAEHIGFRNWNSEMNARPILETVIPVKGPSIMAGLTGELDANSGMEWSGRSLKVNEWKACKASAKCAGISASEFESAEYETRIFVALTGDEKVEYEVLLSEYASKWNISIDKTSGSVGPDKNIDYVTVRAPKSTLEQLSEEEDIHLYISYPQGKVDVKLQGFRKDIIEVPAQAYSFKSEGFEVLEDLGSWDSGVKLFPVTENSEFGADTPYLEFEVDVKEEGEYRIIFQTLPTNPYTAGENVYISYSVNSDDISDVETVKVLPDDYQPGISEEWGRGVLTHVRYTEALQLEKLDKGINKIRFYAVSRENVLEKIIIKKKQEEVVTKIIYG